MSHIEGVIRAALQDDAGLTAMYATIWLPEDPPEGSAVVSDTVNFSAMPNGPQWLSDLVTTTEVWAVEVGRGVVSPPPCEHQYCRDQSYGLCFGVTGAIMDITTAGAIPVPSAPPSPTEPTDIVDRIDELVNDQLANYGNRSGYDHNVNQDLCPHCGREWHGLKITARIEQMRSLGRYDEDYRYADDDSEVLCEGSEFIGPMKFWPKSEPWTFSAPATSRANAHRLVRCECGWQYGAFLPPMLFGGGVCRVSVVCQNCERTLVIGNDIPEGQ